MVLAGVLDIDASRKAARFVRFCDGFEIPIVTFVDVPGLPARHRAGIWRPHQAWREAAVRLFAEARCRKVTVITRKAYGGAYDVMASKHIGADVNYAWPTARDRGDGAERGGGDHLPAEHQRSRQDRGAAQEATRTASPIPFVAAERGYIDEVIMPSQTRSRVARALAMLRGKKARAADGANTTTSHCEAQRVFRKS